MSERGRQCSEVTNMTPRERHLDEIRHSMQETYFREEAQRLGRPYLTPEQRAAKQRQVQMQSHWKENERKLKWLYPGTTFESYIPKDYELEGVEPPAPSHPKKPVSKHVQHSKRHYKGMPARYPGRCIICGEPIEVGDDIRWAKGHGAWHVACDKPAPLPQFGENTSIEDYFPEAHQVEWDHKRDRKMDVPIPIL